ncbi:jg1471, partial [Pararge aegeria aegeria]
RSLRIVAESYAIKGLCLEQTALPGSSSRFKQAERESEMVRIYLFIGPSACPSVCQIDSLTLLSGVRSSI